MSQNEQPAHHKMGPSSSDKWMNCPGSVQAEQGYENTSSPAADEGSAAHALAELTLKCENICSTDDFIGDIIYTGEDGTEYAVDQEMADYIQGYVNFVHQRFADLGGK